MKIKDKIKKVLISIIIVFIIFNSIIPNYVCASVLAETLAQPATELLQFIFDLLYKLVIVAAIPGGNALELDVMYDNGTEVSNLVKIGEEVKRELRGEADESEYKESKYVKSIPSGYDIKFKINQDNIETGEYGIPQYIISPIELITSKVPMLDANYFKDSTDFTNEKKTIRDNIRSWYNTFRMIAILGLLCVLVYLGIRIIISASVTDKVKYKQMMVDWVVALCLIFCLNYIMSFVMNLSDYLITFIAEMSDEQYYNERGGGEFVLQVDNLTTQGGTVYFPSNIIGYVRLLSASKENNITQLMYAIMYAVLVILTLIFLFTYYKRFFTLTFLTFISPLVALTYPIDKIRDGKAQAFSYWLREYITNAFIPVVHVILYKIFILSVPELVKDSPIYAMFVLAFMLPATKIVKSMFGIRGETAPPPDITGATMAGNLISKGASEAGSFFGGAGAAATNKLTAKNGSSEMVKPGSGSEIFKTNSGAPKMPEFSSRVTPNPITQSSPTQTTSSNSTQRTTDSNGGQIRQSSYTGTNNMQQPVRIGNNGQMLQNYGNGIEQIRINETNKARDNAIYSGLDEREKKDINNTLKNNNQHLTRDQILAARGHNTIPSSHQAEVDAATEMINGDNLEHLKAMHYYNNMTPQQKLELKDKGIVLPGESEFNKDSFTNAIIGENGFSTMNPDESFENDFENAITFENNLEQDTDINDYDYVYDEMEPSKVNEIYMPTIKNHRMANLGDLISRRYDLARGKNSVIKNTGKIAFTAGKKGVKYGLMSILGITGAGISLAKSIASGEDPSKIMESGMTGAFTGITMGKSVGNSLNTKMDQAKTRVSDDIDFLRYGEDFEKEQKKREFLSNNQNRAHIRNILMSQNGGEIPSKKEIQTAQQLYWDWNDAAGGNQSMKSLDRAFDLYKKHGGKLTAESTEEARRNETASERVEKVLNFKSSSGYNYSSLSSAEKQKDFLEYATNQYKAGGIENASGEAYELLNEVKFLTGVDKKLKVLQKDEHGRPIRRVERQQQSQRQQRQAPYTSQETQTTQQI